MNPTYDFTGQVALVSKQVFSVEASQTPESGLASDYVSVKDSDPCPIPG